MSDNDDWDDEPTEAPKPRKAAPTAPADDWDDDWDDEAPRAGKRDMTLIYAVVAATIVIVLAIVLTSNKDSNNKGNDAAATSSTETSVKKDLVWQGPVAEAVNEVDKRIKAETGVFIWTDFQGWHVRSNLKDPVSVDVTADAIVVKDANGKATGNPKTEVTETLQPGDGSKGLDLDLQFSNTATYKVAVNGTPLPPAEIKLGGAKGIADQNPVTFTKA